MAMELESKIMNDIGLANHYSWYNGSGSCRYIRIEAVKNLLTTMQNYNREEIALPNNNLIRTLTDIAESNAFDEYVLTETWQSISYVIAECIHQAKVSDEERSEAYRILNKYLTNNYLVSQKDIGTESFLQSWTNRILEDTK